MSSTINMSLKCSLWMKRNFCFVSPFTYCLGMFSKRQKVTIEERRMWGEVSAFFIFFLLEVGMWHLGRPWTSQPQVPQSWHWIRFWGWVYRYGNHHAPVPLSTLKCHADVTTQKRCLSVKQMERPTGQGQKCRQRKSRTNFALKNQVLPVGGMTQATGSQHNSLPS